RRGVFPKNLIVVSEGALGFVDGTEEAGLRAVEAFDDTCLAMEKDAVLGDNSDLYAATGQQVVQLAVTLPMEQRFDFGGRLVPALLQGSLTHVLRHRHISGIEFAVADNTDMWDRSNLLTYKLENGAAEVAGDALVGLRAFELRAEEGTV